VAGGQAAGTGAAVVAEPAAGSTEVARMAQAGEQ
jgi:hypothetical protein